MSTSPLPRSAARGVTEQLAERFAQRIRDQLLAPGARLPSIRQCAEQHGVNPSTVVAAYDRLLAQGLVVAAKNRGFFVRDGREDQAHRAKNAINLIANDTSPDIAQHADHDQVWRTRQGASFQSVLTAAQQRAAGRSVNAAAFMRGLFEPVSDKPQPGLGLFPPEWLAAPFLQAALRRVMRSTDLAAQVYGEPMGNGALRQALSQRLHGLGVAVPSDQILTTVGATQALDLVSRTVLQPGDSVMVEEPGWAVEFARLEALGMRVLPVPRGADGPDLAVMARYCEAHAGTREAPRLYVSVSVLHNPTGTSLTAPQAHRILQLAEAHDFVVVEDDTYGAIAPDHATRLAVLDGLRRTFYIGSFSKILAPNWRVGYLASPREWVERLLDTKLIATLTTPSLLESALALCIEQGQLRRHAQHLRQRLDGARERSVRLALAAGCRFVTEPAGLLGWVDVGVDTEALTLHMLDEGYLLAPGALFHATRQPSTCMRINFATTQHRAFWDALVRVRDRMG